MQWFDFFGPPCIIGLYRYHVFLQLKKDILDGRFVPPLKSAAILASYAAQCEYQTGIDNSVCYSYNTALVFVCPFVHMSGQTLLPLYLMNGLSSLDETHSEYYTSPHSCPD